MSEIALTDERVIAGMARQRDAMASVLYDGGRRIGWKVGMNAPAAQEALGLDGPVAGYLTDAALLADGATVSLDGWETPRLEAEVAVRLSRDVPGDASREDAMAAVDAVAAAIELVDLGSRALSLEEILGGNVFHRAVVLGPWDTSRAGLRLDGVALDVRGLVDEVAGADPQGIADLGEILRHTAWFLAAAGEGLSAGDVVITGAIVPPAPVEAGFEVVVDLGPAGRASVRFA
jgi:2-keto-4-pentenoate hydratase